jgi:hypothetical protein
MPDMISIPPYPNVPVNIPVVMLRRTVGSFAVEAWTVAAVLCNTACGLVALLLLATLVVGVVGGVAAGVAAGVDAKTPAGKASKANVKSIPRAIRIVPPVNLWEKRPSPYIQSTFYHKSGVNKRCK